MDIGVVLQHDGVRVILFVVAKVLLITVITDGANGETNQVFEQGGFGQASTASLHGEERVFQAGGNRLDNVGSCTNSSGFRNQVGIQRVGACTAVHLVVRGQGVGNTTELVLNQRRSEDVVTVGAGEVVSAVGQGQVGSAWASNCGIIGSDGISNVGSADGVEDSVDFCVGQLISGAACSDVVVNSELVVENQAV